MKPAKYKEQSSLVTATSTKNQAYGLDVVAPAWLRLEPTKWLLTRDADDDDALPGLGSAQLWLDLGGCTFRTTQGLYFQRGASVLSRAEAED